jgi:hypothetical protein
MSGGFHIGCASTIEHGDLMVAEIQNLQRTVELQRGELAKLRQVIARAALNANMDDLGGGCYCNEKDDGPLEGEENDENHRQGCPRHLLWVLRGSPDEGAQARFEERV